VNYYEHHIGDYDSATAHLSLIEDAIYRRLICLYYRTEAPLPVDVKAVCRLVRAASKPERNTVQDVLGEFFDLREDGWHNDRCDAEIARFKDKQSKARRSADARWNAQRSQSDGNANASANASPDAMRTHSEGNAPRARPQTPDTSHQTPDTRGGDAREAAPTPPRRAGSEGKPGREIGEPEGLNREALERWEGYLRHEINKPLGLFSRPGVMRQLVAYGDAETQAAVVENCITRRSKNLHPIDRPASGTTATPYVRAKTVEELEAMEAARANG